jgi:lipocalin
LSEEVYSQLLKKAEERGYDLSRLIKVQQRS